MKDKKLRRVLFGCEDDEQIKWEKFIEIITDSVSRRSISYWNPTLGQIDKPSLQQQLNAIMEHLGIEVVIEHKPETRNVKIQKKK